ncbi:MAG: hypothetical protein MHM6MM_009619, partial [Cercozoa sp. M6MM]
VASQLLVNQSMATNPDMGPPPHRYYPASHSRTSVPTSGQSDKGCRFDKTHKCGSCGALAHGTMQCPKLGF